MSDTGQGLNPAVQAAADAMEEFVLGQDVTVTAIGFRWINWTIPTGREVVQENAEATEVQFVYLDADNQNTPGAYHVAAVNIPRRVTEMQLYRAVYELATRRGLRHAITPQGLAGFFRSSDDEIMARFMEKTS